MNRVKKGKNLENIQEMNRSLITKLMHEMGVCSRAELTQASGLNQSTITNIINELMNWGLVVETGMIVGKKGRRSIGISLNHELFKIVGIRITRQNVVVALLDLAGKTYAKQVISIDTKEGPLSAIKKTKELVSSMFMLHKEDIIAISVAAPGPFHKKEGRVALMTNFTGWETINIEDNLYESFNVPVIVEHDANAGGFYHFWDKNDQNNNDVLVYVTAGQGVGAGILSNGQIFQGHVGMAGEIGHMSINFNGPLCECGHKGCLELYSSTTAILKRLSISNGDIETIIANLKDNDVDTSNAVEDAANYLGFGLVNLVNVFNPNRIVIGDELAKVGSPLLENITNMLKSNLMDEVFKPLTIELTNNEDDILEGAVLLAIDKLMETPSKFFNKQTSAKKQKL